MNGKVVILIVDGVPDSAGDTFRLEGIQLPEKEVPVILEFRRSDFSAYVGTAKLSISNGMVIADMKLLPRLAENSALHKLYPSIGGQVIERKDRVIHTCAISEVGVSITQNSDHRIQTLGEQGVKL